jgi:hypothetical protein
MADNVLSILYLGKPISILDRRELILRDSGIQADRERWWTPCGQHGTRDRRISSSQHAWGLGGPLHFPAMLTGEGSNQAQGKIAWIEGDKSAGTLKWRVYPTPPGGGERESLKTQHFNGLLISGSPTF